MKGCSHEKTSAALAVISRVAATKSIKRDHLIETAKQQFALIARYRKEGPIRAIFLGIILNILKEGCAHGEWTPLYQQMLQTVTFCSPTTAKRLASEYMRLSIEALAATEMATPEFLALPGNQLSFALEPSDAVGRRFVAKLEEYVDDRSVDEMLTDLGFRGGSAVRRGKKLEKAAENKPSKEESARTLQECFNAIEEHLHLAVVGTLDRATWMSFSRQQHEDLRHIFDQAAADIRARFLKTHPQHKEESK
jgi:hypothetical protein